MLQPGIKWRSTLETTCREFRQTTTVWRQQRKRPQAKGSMSKTIAVHVGYKSLYISLLSSARQHREMTKLCIFWRTRTMTASFSYFHLELNASVTYLAWASSETNRLTEKIRIIALSSELPCPLLKFFNIRTWRWGLSCSRTCNSVNNSVNQPIRCERNNLFFSEWPEALQVLTKRTSGDKNV